jgi:opacity protein-like surface antigen
VQEGFTYYFRGDLGYGWSGDRSFSESGAIYGEDTATPFTSASLPIPFTLDTANVFHGTVGIGAYFTPWLRGDLTADFRGDQENVARGSYEYVAPSGLVRGAVVDSLKVRSTVALANIYIEPLPRGMFTPYVGAGIGFVYNDTTRTYLNTETIDDGTPPLTPRSRPPAQGKETSVELAAALMAGVTFAFNHRWAIDVGYRAMYLGGVSTTVTIPSLVLPQAQTTTAELGSNWEHQVRVGVRFNIW